MRALVDISEEEARAVCARDDEIDHCTTGVRGRDGADGEAPDRARQATHSSSRRTTWSGWATG